MEDSERQPPETLVLPDKCTTRYLCVFIVCDSFFNSTVSPRRALRIYAPPYRKIVRGRPGLSNKPKTQLVFRAQKMQKQSLSPVSAVAPRPFAWGTRSAATLASAVQASMGLPPPCGPVRISVPVAIGLEDVVHQMRHAGSGPVETVAVQLVRDGAGDPRLPGTTLAWALRRQGAPTHAAIVVGIEVTLTRAQKAEEPTRRPLVRMLLAGVPLAWRSLAALRCGLVDAEQPVLLWYNNQPVPWSVETLHVPRGWCAAVHVGVVDVAHLSRRFAAVVNCMSRTAVVGRRREAAHEALPAPLDGDGNELPDTRANGDAGAVVVYDVDGYRLLRANGGDVITVNPPCGANAFVAACGPDAVPLACDVAETLAACSAF